MNTSGDKLRISAETDNIDLLYEVIQDDPSILEIIDENRFAETPLHIAAYRGHRGHLEFAMEIMNLKPSFATKLNLQGHSPIHHAMVSLTRLDKESPTYLAEANHLREMMYELVRINNDLVRVKGREGLTPLHFACQIGDVGIVGRFIKACPDSIKDVTVKGESALHIAAKNQHYEAFSVLVDSLDGESAEELKRKVFYLEDKAGNTVLHITALRSEPKFLQLLVDTATGMRLHAKNLENKTALDLAKTEEMKNILISAEKKFATKNSLDKISDMIIKIRSYITEEERNTCLIIATLVATVTYESALSPPGGVFQVSASDDKNSVKIKSTTGFFSTQGNAGKSILSREVFMVYSIANILSFSVSIIAILIMTPRGVLKFLVIAPVLYFYMSYLIAMLAVSPTQANTIILSIPLYSIFLMVACFVNVLLIRRLISLLRFYKRPTTQTAVPRVQTV